MQLNVRKIAQGPVLAKGETDCGKVEIAGQSMAGCSVDLEGDASISAGGTYKNDGTVGVQYQSTCSC